MLKGHVQSVTEIALDLGEVGPNCCSQWEPCPLSAPMSTEVPEHRLLSQAAG